jgi:pyruvate formate lyase activating enzyme
MVIRGFQKVSIIDFPGNICATIFTGGCNLRCRYCYNRNLVLNPEKLPKYFEDDILFYLDNRKDKLDGVCISGGEPTLQPDLGDFIEKIKSLDLKVKLDTNGTNPDKLKELLPILDYVAMDIKAPLDKYSYINKCTDGHVQSIRESIEALKKSRIPHEFRTTLVPVLTLEDIIQIRKLIPYERYVIQQFRLGDTLIDPELNKLNPYPPEEVRKMADDLHVRASVRGI